MTQSSADPDRGLDPVRGPRLLLVRHTAPGIAPGVCYGRLDVPARPLERDAWLADWDAGCHPGHPRAAYQRLISSPARRCRILAAALAQRLGLPLDIDPAWQELDFGAWEGQSWDAIGRSAVDAWAADPLNFAPGAGESARAMTQRVVAAYEAWRRQGQDTILVTHGGVIRLLQAWHAAWPADGASLELAALEATCLRALGQSPPPHGGLLLLEPFRASRSPEFSR